MSKRTRGEEGLALALATPESSPSSAALLFGVRQAVSTTGLTLRANSIAHASRIMPRPNLERICNRTSFKTLEVGKLGEGPARRAQRGYSYDMNVTLRQAV